MQEATLRRIFADVFNLEYDGVSSDMSPETVDSWDSFGHMQLITAVEGNLGIQLRMEQILAVDSYDALCRVVAEATRQ